MPPVSPQVIALLERDVVCTVGERYRRRVAETAQNAARLEIADPDTKLVEDVQQEFHDTFVDTTWPACPRHGRHPLWYREDGWWWCEQDQVAICKLGEVATLSGGITGPPGEPPSPRRRT
jgi:hypothetical protein